MSQNSFGTTFKWGTVAVAKLTNIGGVEATAEMIDGTTHDSEDGYDEVTPGLIKTGEVPIAGNFEATDTTGQLAMVTDFNAKASKQCVITFPGGQTWTFTGFISKIKIGDNPVNGLIPFTASIKPTGKPVFALGT